MTEENKPKNDGLRYDSGKVEFDLIPPEAMFALAAVLTKGAMKYERRNWEKGMDWGKCFNSLQRHLWAWLAKENGGFDEETGLSHMAHAMCNCLFLLTYEEREVGQDNRPTICNEKLKKSVEAFNIAYSDMLKELEKNIYIDGNRN